MSAEVLSSGSRHGSPVPWFLGLLAGAVVWVGTWWYASYYWTMPLFGLVALVALGGVLVAMLVMVGVRARRKVAWVIGALAAAAAVAAATAVLTIALPGSLLPVDARIRQISDELGYAVVLPADEERIAEDGGGYAPASSIDESGRFTIHFERFDVREEQSASVLSATALEEYLDLPEGDTKSGVSIVLDSTETMKLKGNPALAATWHEQMSAKGAQNPSHVLIFQTDGLIVRLSAGEAWEGETPGGEAIGGGLSAREMVRLAETFEPFE